MSDPYAFQVGQKPDESEEKESFYSSPGFKIAANVALFVVSTSGKKPVERSEYSFRSHTNQQAGVFFIQSPLMDMMVPQIS